MAEAVPAGGVSAHPRESLAERELYVDTTTQQVFVRGNEVLPPLSREQYALLAFLFENAGKLCLRDDIISRAWPDALGGVSDEAVDALVHRVRERLRAAGASKLFIVTSKRPGISSRLVTSGGPLRRRPFDRPTVLRKPPAPSILRLASASTTKLDASPALSLRFPYDDRFRAYAPAFRPARLGWGAVFPYPQRGLE